MTDANIFGWRAYAIQCARRFYHSYLHETTKVNFKFLNVSSILFGIVITSFGEEKAGALLAVCFCVQICGLKIFCTYSLCYCSAEIFGRDTS